MSAVQRGVLVAVALAIAALLLMPPWVLRHDADWVGRVRAGHHFVAVPPRPSDFSGLVGAANIWYAAIDGGQLVVEFLAISALGGVGLLLAGCRRSGDRIGDRDG